MHKYWSRKPADLVSHWIETYSQPGDVVLDPFCGSGVTIIEAASRNRRAAGLDINPMAMRLTRMGLLPVDLDSFDKVMKSLRKTISPAINAMYRFTCTQCGSDRATFTHLVWDDNQVVHVRYTCPNCKTRHEEIKGAFPPPPDCDDSGFPNMPLFANARVNISPGMHLADLFSQRARCGLVMLWNQIQRLTDPVLKEHMTFVFTAALPQTSNMVFVINRRNKKGKRQLPQVGSWVVGFWSPAKHFEVNVWRCFENAYRRVRRGKVEVNQLGLDPDALVENWPGFQQQSSPAIYLQNGSATHLAAITDNSVDYIFTDPPHGDRLPFLELSLLWNAWFDEHVDYDKELVVSGVSQRDKTPGDFAKGLHTAVAEMARVLKPNHHLSLAYNSLDDDTWLALFRACSQNGLRLIDITPMAYSAGSVAQDSRKHALKTDFVLTFQQTDNSLPDLPIHDDPDALATIIRDGLRAAPAGQTTHQVLNRVMVRLVSAGQVPLISSILAVLKEHFTFKNSRWHTK